MALFSLAVALILEQIKPLPQQRFVATPLAVYAGFLEEHLNAGQVRHGVMAWLVAVLPPVIVVAVVHALLISREPLLAALFDVGVLYLTMGFRQFSHFFTDIHLALRMGELDRARGLMALWRAHSVDTLTSNEVARLAIEEALVASHRHVFAPLMWFVVFGPAGAMLYRLTLFFWQLWGVPQLGAFGEFSRRAFAVVDWVPLRVSSAAFAIVGDFEGAVFCWRTQAARWPDAASATLLACGAGALGVRLGLPVHDNGTVDERPELGLGDEADADFMQSAIGLVWRTLVLFMLLLALFWVASWVA